MVHDPVCSMEIKDTIKAPASVYKSKTYYFCTDLCKIKFEEDPGKYIKQDDGKEHEHHHHP